MVLVRAAIIAQLPRDVPEITWNLPYWFHFLTRSLRRTIQYSNTLLYTKNSALITTSELYKRPVRDWSNTKQSYGNWGHW